MKIVLVTFAAILAATPALAITSAASATIGGVDGGAQGFTTSRSGTSQITFDSNAGCDQSLLTTSGVTTNGNVVIAAGTSPTRSLPGGNDTSCFASIGPNGPKGNRGTGTLDISGSAIGGSANYFGLYWGSVDAYNSISFLDSSGKAVPVYSSGRSLGSVLTGKSLARVFGLSLGYPAQSVFVNFDFNTPIFSIIMKSTDDAFEFDNIAFISAPTTNVATAFALGSRSNNAGLTSFALAVPEPGTVALFGLSIAAFAISRRRLTV